MSNRLSRGMALPETVINMSDGSTLTLPNDMADGYKVILFYRGAW